MADEIPGWASGNVASPTAITTPPTGDVPDWAKTEPIEPPPSGGTAVVKEQLPRDISVGRAGVEAIKHIPESAVGFAKSAVQPIVHPVDTYESLKNLGAGVLQKFGIMGGKDREKYADAVGQFLKDRYGSVDNIKYTLATDPVGLAADVSLLFSGGGTAAARVPGVIGKIGEITQTVGRVADPLSAVGAVGRGGVAIGRRYAGDYLAHVGDRPLAEAFRAGREGGESARQFRASLRDPKSQFTETVEMARRAVDEVGAEAGRVYRSGMADIGKDYHILDFGKINSAIQQVEGIGKYKGVDLRTPKARETFDEMTRMINEWRGYAPAQYHTAEGFDALKKSLGYVAEETERGTPASKVAWSIYNSVKDTITDQAPAYAKIMNGYSEGKQIIRELETQLTGKSDAPIGPALRKLQSVLRDNVHTAFGQREALAQFLVDNGAEHLITRLAGQALSTWTPRGFGRGIASADLVYGVGEALIGNPKALAATLLTLPMMSPRLLGETAYYAGRGSPYLPGRKTGDVLFQAGRVGEAERTPVQNTVSYDAQGNPIQ